MSPTHFTEGHWCPSVNQLIHTKTKMAKIEAKLKITNVDKTRIMANIQTLIRLINVKETYEEVCKAMDLQWMELTEDTSFGKTHKRERKIRLNRNYIIEVQP